MNARGTDLLASLIGFFRPTTPNADITGLCASVEGQQLLQALGNFFNLVVDSEGNGNTGAQEVINISVKNMEEHFNKEYPSLNETTPEESISSSAEGFLFLSNLVDLYPHENALPTMLVDEVRKKVFNSMPIRMLSFDSTGRSCTLVDRSTLVDIILFRIHAVYPERHDLSREIDPGVDGLVDLVSEFCRYAILSHTWLRGSHTDVLFHDWANRELPRNGRGNAKIDNFCTVAACRHGLQLGWMDTVCIDKESSAELDESIRSMYKWYKTAHVCIAYLADTHEFAEIPNDLWFTRGWTLQELVANRNIYFYNRDWAELHAPDNFDAHLSDPDFISHKEVLSDIFYSGMPEKMQYQVCKATTLTWSELIFLYLNPSQIPICRIMELAAMRMVTRAEDQVYSLMGLLDTSISVAYGEGAEHALRRMILQIMISRKDFRYLFNHTNKESILPSDISDYIGHSKMVKGPFMDHPKTPISLSHLGVHGTFLAIPLFNKDAFNFPPNICMSSMLLPNDNPTAIPTTYIALDDSTDASEWISNLKIALTPHTERLYKGFPVIFLALLMSDFDQDRDRIYLPIGKNLGVAVKTDQLNRGHDTITTQFTDINPITSQFDEHYGPKEIELQYGKRKARVGNLRIFTGEKARRLGFRVISSYFR